MSGEEAREGLDPRGEDLAARLRKFVAEAVGADAGRVTVENLQRLAGGASRELW